MRVHEFWQHITSGEVIAVALDHNGRVLEAAGPLHHTEVSLARLKRWDFNDDADLAESLRAGYEAWHVMAVDIKGGG